MSQTNIFGLDYDELYEIVVESGVHRAELDRVRHQVLALQNYESARSMRNKLYSILKGAGVTLTVAKLAAQAVYQKAWEKEDPSRATKLRRVKDSQDKSDAVSSKLATDNTSPTNRKTVQSVAVDAAGNVISPPKKRPREDTLWEANKVQNKFYKWLDEGDAKAKTVQQGVKAPTMADVEMNGPSGSENQVTPVSRFTNAFEGIPRQYTTICPYWYNSGSTAVPQTAGSKNYQIALRMNSVYDVFKVDGLTYFADPTVAADVADAGTKEKPMYRDHWMGYYEYWTVVECRYKITTWVPENNVSCQIGVAWGYTGLQKPPTTSTGSVDITYDEYKRWKGWKVATIAGVDTTGGNTEINSKNSFTISGVYHPGDGVHEVAEDELVQTWVKGDNVPKEQNLLWIRWFNAPFNTDPSPTFRYRVELEYVVQFKDQKAIFQFPHTSTFPGVGLQ